MICIQLSWVWYESPYLEGISGGSLGVGGQPELQDSQDYIETLSINQSQLPIYVR